MAHLGDILFFLSKALKSKTEAELRDKGIGIGQLQLLMTLYSVEDHTLSQKSLVDILKIDKGNISKNIKKLKEKYYVEDDLNDRGEKVIIMTSSGLKVIGEIIPILSEIEDGLLLGIEQEDIKSCTRVMLKMMENLEARQ